MADLWFFIRVNTVRNNAKIKALRAKTNHIDMLLSTQASPIAAQIIKTPPHNDRGFHNVRSRYPVKRPVKNMPMNNPGIPPEA
jgi:hypothetical protein